MSKLKIATHDSATGEASHGLISLLVIPFARTQNKTIVEQYNAGCRSFDIRVRYSKKRYMWICAHGLWESVRPAEDIINEINNFPDKCEVCVTYEGTIDNKAIFEEFATHIRIAYINIIWGSFCCKYGEKISTKVEYVTVQYSDVEYSGGVQGFVPLDGRSWHTYIPIPWLWDVLYKRPHKFNEEKYTFVDFL